MAFHCPNICPITLLNILDKYTQYRIIGLLSMAMSGRIYTVSVSNATLAAVQDMISITVGASKIIAILSVNIGQVTGTSVANQRIRLRYLPVTVSAGSGGSAITPRPWVPGDAAATVTARQNDTVQATTNGTAIDLWDDQWNIINGFIFVPPIPSRPPIIGISGAFILSLDTAPASLVTNYSVTFEELP
jgi:hypothetical protein